MPVKLIPKDKSNPLIAIFDDDIVPKHPRTFFAIQKRQNKRIRTAAKFQDHDTTDPYTTTLLNMMEDAILNDVTVQRAIDYLITFTLGSRTRPVLDVRYDTDAEGKELDEPAKQTIIDGKTNNIPHKVALKIIRRIEQKRDVAFNTKLHGLMEQAYSFGRAALGIEDGQIKIDGIQYDNLPIALKQFATRNLGKVEINKDTWRVETVEYSDFSPTGSMQMQKVEADDMIYLVHKDTNTKPDSLGYGRSRLQSSIHLSEINRIATELDVKEIIRSLWAGVFSIKVNSRNQSTINNIKTQYKAGRTVAHNQDIELTEHKIQHDLDKIIEAMKEISFRIAQGVGVPNAIMGWEEVQNRATLEGVLQAWEASTLKAQRTWVCNYVEPQWYDRILKAIFQVEDADELPIKVTLEFKPITFSAWVETVDAVSKLLEKALVTKQRALKLLNMGDDIVNELEEAAAEGEERRQQEMEKFKAEGEMQQKRKVEIQDKRFPPK